MLSQIDAKIDQLPEKISDLIGQNSESKVHSNTSIESQSDDQLTSVNSLIDNSDQLSVAADNPDDGSEQNLISTITTINKHKKGVNNEVFTPFLCQFFAS